MEAWHAVLFAFGGNAALLAVLGLLGKSLLDKLILRETKQFEADLVAKSASAIERLKNELQLKTIEHQVRFTRLHEKRAAVIAELYGHLVEALWEAESFLSPAEWVGEPSKDEKHQAAQRALVELYRFFDKHRIYLPEAQCVALDSLVRDVRSRVGLFGTYLRYNESGLPQHALDAKYKAWQDGWDAIKNQLPAARASLEAEFRALLGSADAILSIERPEASAG